MIKKFIVVILILFLVKQPFQSFSSSIDTTYAHQLIINANLNIKTGKNGQAIKILQDAVSLFQNVSIIRALQIQIQIVDQMKIIGFPTESLDLLLQMEKQCLTNKEILNYLPAVYHNIGSYYLSKGQIEPSIKYLQKAILYNDKFHSFKSIYKTYANLASTFQYKGDYSKSLEYFYKSLKIKKINNPKPDKELSMIMQSFGRLFYTFGEIDSALFYFQKSLTIYKSISSKNDIQLGLLYSNYGVVFKNLGLYKEALTYYKNAESIFLAVLGPNDQRLDAIYSNLGNIYLHQGDFDNAIQYFINSKNLIIGKDENSLKNLISIYQNLASAYMFKNDYKIALNYLNLCISIKEKSFKNVYIDIAYGRIAKCYRMLGDNKNAQKFYEKSIEKVQSLNLPNNPEVAVVYINYGQFLLANNEKQKAIELFSKALEINLKHYGIKNPATASSYLNIGDYYSFYNLPEKAVLYYQNALISISRQFNSKSIIDNPEINESLSDLILLSTLKKKASSLLEIWGKIKKEDNAKIALNTLKLADQLTQKMQIGFLSEESKIYITEIQQSTYWNIVNTSLQLYEKTRSNYYLEITYSYIEKSKSSVLLSIIKESEARNTGKIPEKLKQKESDLSQKLSVYKELIFKEQQQKKPNEELLKIWQQKILTLSGEKDKLLKYFETNFPDYFALKYNTETISLKKLQEKLRKDEILIEYMINDSQLIALFITSDNIGVSNTQINNDLSNNIRLLRSCLNPSSFEKDAYKNYTEFSNSSYFLYKLLIEKALKFTDKSHLVIVPAGELSLIPFEILTKKYPKKNDLKFKSLDYLIKSYSIRYCYSATLGFRDFSHSKPNSNKLLAFAPDYNQYNSLSKTNYEKLKQYKDILIPLRGAQNEVTAITKTIKGDIYSGEKATESNFKNVANKYAILHLAMHTILDNENSNYSKLAFTFNNDTLEDGFLNIYELFGLNLNAKLTVLSACNSGSGKIYGSEGVMSFARGIILAGCPNVVITLWPLEDQSGLEIMSSFYTFLAKGQSIDESLRNSRLDFLTKADNLKSHPYFWAGYIFIGQSEPIYKNRNWKYIYLLAGIFFVCAILYMYRKRK